MWGSITEVPLGYWFGMFHIQFGADAIPAFIKYHPGKKARVKVMQWGWVERYSLNNLEIRRDVTSGRLCTSL